MGTNVRPTEMFTRSSRLPTGYVSTVEAAIKNFGTLDSVETGSSTCTADSDTYEFHPDQDAMLDDFRAIDFSNIELTTGKTSASSSDWDVACEYDLMEADRVRLMFAAMFGMLFERLKTDASPAHLARECHEWNSCFPHLRLLGEQLLSPQDKGYDHFPAPDTRKDSSDSGLEMESDNSEGISLLGRKLEPNTPPSTARSGASTNSQVSSLGAKDDLVMEELDEEQTGLNDELIDCEEEIFEAEGIYEDIIAVDYRLGEDDTSEQLRRYVRQRRHGLPPMTPSAAIRDSVCNNVFDILWADCVTAIRPLVAHMLHGPKKTDLDLDMQSHLPHISPGDMGVLTTAQRDLAFPKLPRTTSSVSNDSKTLTGLLHITTKTLQYRERSYLQDIPESPPIERRATIETRPPPTSSMRLSGPEPRIPSAARRGRGRLVPLDRSRAAQVDEDTGFGLVGVSMQTPGAATDALTRSGTLPPLSMSLLVKPASSQRINSAAAGRNAPPTTNTRPVHHSFNVGSSELRPSTTHTFHPSSLSLKPISSLLNLGVHGFSIGNTQGHNAGVSGPAGVEEEEEKRARVPWGPVYPASLYPVHQVLRRGKSNTPMHNSTVR